MVGPGRPWQLLLAYGIGAQLAVALPGQYHPLLPTLASAADHRRWLEALGSFVRIAGMPRWAFHAAGVAVIVLMLAEQLPLYQVPPEAWSRLKYGELFVREQQLQARARRAARARRDLLRVGCRDRTLLQEQALAARGAFYVFPLLAGPAAMPLASRAVADLERHRP
jgi:hypothetical protein